MFRKLHFIRNRTRSTQPMAEQKQDDTAPAKAILAKIMASDNSGPSYQLDFAEEAHLFFSNVLRYSSESDMLKSLDGIKQLIENDMSSTARMRLTSIIKGAEKARKDFERWGCQIARYRAPNQIDELASRYTNSRKIDLQDEMQYGEQCFKDAEEAFRLCTHPDAKPSEDGSLSFLANTVVRNEFTLRVAVEYLIACHYKNSLNRGSEKWVAEKMKTVRIDVNIDTPLETYNWATPIRDEMYELARTKSVEDLEFISSEDGYKLIYDREHIGSFVNKPVASDTNQYPKIRHGLPDIKKYWPRLESLFHMAMFFPLNPTNSESLKAFYNHVIEIIWLMGFVTPVERGTGKLVEQIFTIIHLRHALRTPALVVGKQLDVLDITYALSIYKQIKLFKTFFEPESLCDALVADPSEVMTSTTLSKKTDKFIIFLNLYPFVLVPDIYSSGEYKKLLQQYKTESNNDRNYAHFKAMTHFIDESVLSNLKNMIADIEKRGMEVNIVLTGEFKRYFDLWQLKKILSDLDFVRYIYDKTADHVEFRIHKNETFNLHIVNDGVTSARLKKAVDENSPILQKWNNHFYIYGCRNKIWSWTRLYNLTHVEHKILSDLCFKNRLIENVYPGSKVMELLQRGHVQEKFHNLYDPELIELWLKQHPEITQFIILDRDNNIDYSQQLFPGQLIPCKNLYTTANLDHALNVINEIITRKDNPADIQEIHNKVTPSVTKTRNLKNIPPPGVDTFDVSIRVLNQTRMHFIKSTLMKEPGSPFKNQDKSISKHIMDYADVSVRLNPGTP